jgi:hypothetical protein
MATCYEYIGCRMLDVLAAVNIKIKVLWSVTYNSEDISEESSA